MLIPHKKKLRALSCRSFHIIPVTMSPRPTYLHAPLAGFYHELTTLARLLIGRYQSSPPDPGITRATGTKARQNHHLPLPLHLSDQPQSTPINDILPRYSCDPSSSSAHASRPKKPIPLVLLARDESPLGLKFASSIPLSTCRSLHFASILRRLRPPLRRTSATLLSEVTVLPKPRTLALVALSHLRSRKTTHSDVASDSSAEVVRPSPPLVGKAAISPRLPISPTGPSLVPRTR